MASSRRTHRVEIPDWLWEAVMLVSDELSCTPTSLVYAVVLHELMPEHFARLHRTSLRHPDQIMLDRDSLVCSRPEYL